MTDTSPIIANAEALGKEIAESDVFQEFKKYHEQLGADEDARKLLDDHQAILEKVHKLEQENKPVEVDDKHALREAQEKLHSNSLLQDYARVQADFLGLMNQVTSGIHKQIQLDPLFQDEEGGEDK